MIIEKDFFGRAAFILAWTFISLQIKEFRIMGLSINDSVYSSVFFFLTGLHFFHLVVGLLLLSLLFWSCSLSSDYTLNYLWNLECFVEDLFLGGQWSIILGYLSFLSFTYGLGC